MHEVKEITPEEKFVKNVEKLITYVPAWNQESAKSIIDEIKKYIKKE